MKHFQPPEQIPRLASDVAGRPGRQTGGLWPDQVRRGDEPAAFGGGYSPAPVEAVPVADWAAMLAWLTAHPQLRILPSEGQVVLYTGDGDITVHDRSTWQAYRLR